MRVIPMLPSTYKAGCYVTHGPFSEETVGESWYRDPLTGETKHAWTGSLVSTPSVIGPVTGWRLGGIELLPQTVRTEINEPRTIRVVGWEADGDVRRKVHLTRSVKWGTSNSDVAFPKDGVVYAKKFGTAIIQCAYRGFHASSRVVVGYYSAGEKTPFYYGSPRLQQIRFDSDDNLYVCDQSNSVYRLNKTGGIDKTVSIPEAEEQPYGIDCIALDKDRNLYVIHVGRQYCLKFPWSGDLYHQPSELGGGVIGTKKGIAVDDDGNVFIAVMGGPPGTGRILLITPEGDEATFEIRDTAAGGIVLDKRGNVCVLSRRHQAIDVYSSQGNLLSEIPYGSDDAASDIAIDEGGSFYLPLFHSGVLLKVTSESGSAKTEAVASGFQAPCGVAVDSRGRMFVSNFTSDVSSIDVVYV